MKTFEEALNCISRDRYAGGVALPDPVMDKAISEINETMERYQEFAKTAMASIQFLSMLQTWMNSLHPADAVFTAFMSGLIVGMEMEKSDLPELASAK